MRTRREFIRVGGTTAVVATISGCTGGGGGGEDNTTTTESKPGSDVNVGLIYALGGLGDESFSDAAHRGIQQAQDEWGVQFRNTEPESVSDFKTLQQQLAQSSDPNYDLIVCVGFQQVSPLQDNASDYPDQNWMIIDGVVEAPNVESYLFAENEGSYIVGHSAARLSSMEFSAGAGSTKPDQKVLGYIGGMEVPVVQEFEAGYRAGAKAYDQDFEVLSTYVGSFNDVGAVKEAALSMLDDGADIIYDAAGGGGLGQFQATQERGRFSFGKDSRQSLTASEYADVILGSMVKGVESGVKMSVEHVVNENFQGGTTTTLGAGEGGFNVYWGDQLGDDIPQEIKDEAESLKEKIASGEISVPQQP